MDLFKGNLASITKFYGLILGVIVMSACGDDDDDDSLSDLKEVSAVSIVDIANNGNASDIQVYLTQDEEGRSVSQYRVMLVRTSDAGSFNLDAASEVPESGFSVIDTDALDYVLNGSLTDVDGNEVVEGVDYSAFIVSVRGNGKLILSPASNPINLAQKDAVRNLTEYFEAGSGGMDSDESGNIYMGDFGASLSGPPGTQVYLITPSGQVSVFASGLQGASGNEFDSEGNLFQSNISAGTVSRITPSGQVSTFASATIQGPVGITFDQEGNMYVANCGSNDLSIVSPDGTAEKYVTSTLFNCPNGITISDTGTLYIANFGNGNIIRVTADKSVTRLATIPGGNNGHLLFHEGQLWVIDRSGNAIYTVSTGGSIRKIAGTGARGNRNGSPETATFSLPNDLTFSPDGKLVYINDVRPDVTGGGISPVIIRVLELVD